jgi:hypothetical protein
MNFIPPGTLIQPGFLRLLVFLLASLHTAWCVPCKGQSATLYQAEIGFDFLLEKYGQNLADGTGIRVIMPEAPNSNGQYMPSVGNSEFSGKTFANGTIPAVSGSLGHATNVGRFFYGNSTSIAPGISDITGASAVDFALRYTGFETNSQPIAQGFHVSNHSYIIGVDDVSAKLSLLRRFDYIINRDNTLAVVAVNNGGSTATPDLWANSFNAVVVGRSDGNHSRGNTTDYGAGRSIPDIVVPMQNTGFNFTSYAAPVVSASAALLQQAAGFDAQGMALAGGQNQVIRSLLYAGATKSQFPGWSKTSTRPVDERYGFGQLNIGNSYEILQAGQFGAYKSPLEPSAAIGESGWDFGFSSGGDLFYSFEINPGQQLSELSAVLSWNVDIFNTSTAQGIFLPDHQLANLDLELFRSSETFLGPLVQSSVSNLYNYEHIFLNEPLETGKYTFRISGDLPVHYGFAWRMSFDFVTTPEPSSLTTLLIAIGVLAQRRFRRDSSQHSFLP